MNLRERALAVRPRATLWWAATLTLLSVVAVMAACFSAWFQWRHTGLAADFDQGQRSGLALLLARLDFSAVASFSTATPEDAATVRYLGYPARAVVAAVLIGALVAPVRSWEFANSVWLRALFSLTIVFTLLCGLALLSWWAMAAGFNDIEYESISADASVRLTRVLPRGPILLTLAVLLQVGAWRVARAVRLSQG